MNTKNLVFLALLIFALLLIHPVSAGASCTTSYYNVCGNNITCSAIISSPTSYDASWVTYCNNSCPACPTAQEGTSNFGCQSAAPTNGYSTDSYVCAGSTICTFCNTSYTKSGNACVKSCSGTPSTKSCGTCGTTTQVCVGGTWTYTGATCTATGTTQTLSCTANSCSGTLTSTCTLQSGNYNWVNDTCSAASLTLCGDGVCRASCTYCGDNTTQTPNNNGFNEVCDGTDLNSQTCASQGYGSGTLSCKSDCSGFNYSGCSAVGCDASCNGLWGPSCNNGLSCNGWNVVSNGSCRNSLCTAQSNCNCCGNNINDSAAGEECDDGNTNNGDGCDSTCHKTNCAITSVNVTPIDCSGQLCTQGEHLNVSIAYSGVDCALGKTLQVDLLPNTTYASSSCVIEKNLTIDQVSQGLTVFMPGMSSSSFISDASHSYSFIYTVPTIPNPKCTGKNFYHTIVGLYSADGVLRLNDYTSQDVSGIMFTVCPQAGTVIPYPSSTNKLFDAVYTNPGKTWSGCLFACVNGWASNTEYVNNASGKGIKYGPYFTYYCGALDGVCPDSFSSNYASGFKCRLQGSQYGVCSGNGISDPDCGPVCGDGIVTPPEECDYNLTPNGCSHECYKNNCTINTTNPITITPIGCDKGLCNIGSALNITVRFNGSDCALANTVQVDFRNEPNVNITSCIINSTGGTGGMYGMSSLLPVAFSSQDTFTYTINAITEACSGKALRFATPQLYTITGGKTILRSTLQEAPTDSITLYTDDCRNICPEAYNLSQLSESTGKTVDELLKLGNAQAEALFTQYVHNERCFKRSVRNLRNTSCEFTSPDQSTGLVSFLWNNIKGDKGTRRNKDETNGQASSGATTDTITPCNNGVLDSSEYCDANPNGKYISKDTTGDCRTLFTTGTHKIFSTLDTTAQAVCASNCLYATCTIIDPMTQSTKTFKLSWDYTASTRTVTEVPSS